MADTTSLDSILRLMQSLSGKGTTTTESGGTKTTQTVLDQNTINATLRSALEGNQGLASLAAGQANTGIYNSTTNQQLSNDLLARMTTEAAAKGAPTVTTSSGGTSTVKGAGIMDQLGPIAALSLGKKGIDKFFNGDLGNILSFGSDTGGSAISSAVEAGANSAFDFVDTSSLSGIADASSGLADTVISGVSSLGAETVGDSAGEGISSLMPSTVVCTEAARQGAIAQWYLDNELAHLQQHPLNAYVKSGYHVLAAPVVRWMKRSKVATKFFAGWAVSYILGDTQGKSDLKHKFIRYVLFPLCWTVGVVVGKEE